MADQWLWIALAACEVLLVIVLVLLVAWLRSAAARRRDRRAIKSLVTETRKNRDQRVASIANFLESGYGLSGEALDSLVAILYRSEVGLIQAFATTYANRDADAAARFGGQVEAGSEAYWRLSGEAAQPGGGEDATEQTAEVVPASDEQAPDDGEVARLRGENERLSDELRVSMDTMSRMLSEYSTVFSKDGEAAHITVVDDSAGEPEPEPDAPVEADGEVSDDPRLAETLSATDDMAAATRTADDPAPDESEAQAPAQDESLAEEPALEQDTQDASGDEPAKSAVAGKQTPTAPLAVDPDDILAETEEAEAASVDASGQNEADLPTTDPDELLAAFGREDDSSVHEPTAEDTASTPSDPDDILDDVRQKAVPGAGVDGLPAGKDSAEVAAEVDDDVVQDMDDEAVDTDSQSRFAVDLDSAVTDLSLDDDATGETETQDKAAVERQRIIDAES